MHIPFVQKVIECELNSGSTFVKHAPPTKERQPLRLPLFVYPSRRLGISLDYGLYLITEGVYYHALACIHLRLDVRSVATD